MANKIKKLTQVIRNYSECELDYGTLKTLKMIDDESDILIEKLEHTEKCPHCKKLFKPKDIKIHTNYCDQNKTIKETTCKQ